MTERILFTTKSVFLKHVELTSVYDFLFFLQYMHVRLQFKYLVLYVDMYLNVFSFFKKKSH